MAMIETRIRRATPEDLPAIGRLGAHLLRTHYAFDAQRFMAPGSAPEEAYSRFLAGELESDGVAVFVAVREDAVLGYLYAGIEPQSWKELRERAGFVHDVVVAEAGRRMGIAAALIDAALEWMRSRGLNRALLWTAWQNEGAQILFTRLGFRRTMIEMTREL
jgi:ribosomal protein S18 acetylase RimI-like enzyme